MRLSGGSARPFAQRSAWLGLGFDGGQGRENQGARAGQAFRAAMAGVVFASVPPSVTGAEMEINQGDEGNARIAKMHVIVVNFPASHDELMFVQA